MDKLQLKAYGKINLGLDVIRKRPDGYHDLDMIMQMVDVYDDVIIEKKAGEEIVVKADAAVLSNGKDNLAYMAAKMLLDEFKIKSGVEITIHKRIPIAGGMAGGSSDCATTLIGIAIARGIGEVLTPLPTPPQCHVIIAKPPISVSTAYVYGHIRPDEITKRPDIEQMTLAIKEQDLNKLSDLLYNVMEEVTVSEYPVIEKLKSIMLENGALNSIMSGSGPTVFGLFDDRKKAQAAMKALDSKELTEQLYLTKFI